VRGMKTILAVLTILVLMVGCESRSQKPVPWLMSIVTASGTSSEITQTPNSNTESYPIRITVNDVQGTPDFLFNVTETVPIRINVQDAFAPVSNTLVQIREMDATPQVILFQATTDVNGNITGSFTIDKSRPHVDMAVVIDGQEHLYSLDLTQVIEVNRIVRIEGTLGPMVIQDRDKDGIPDSEDVYPDDPTRAVKVRVPINSFSTVAFEDLYPIQGDADFNDYVLRVVNEEDLNAQGAVARIRGTYEHIARGAGYTHELNLRLPTGLLGRYELRRYGYDGNIEYTASGNLTGDINLMPTSSTTLPSWNSRRGEKPEKGKKAELEIILDNPITRLGIGAAPYDIYIYVNNTKREIHFLGKYYKDDGTDKYLDPNGFPWAILIPGNWKYPYERVDVRTSYVKFRSWYESKGGLDNDWYLYPNLDNVYPIE